MKNDIDPMEPGEWFLHMYSTHYLVDFDIPDWGELAYRAELLQTVREIQRNKNHG